MRRTRKLPTHADNSATNVASPDPGGKWANAVLAYSCRQQLTKRSEETAVGAQHSSLSLAGERYLAACARLGVRTVLVRRPEIYGSDVSRQFLAAENEPLIHLATGDYASLRVLKSAYNIACVAWEYDAISTTTFDRESPWKNQRWTLGLFDEVWVGASFVKQAFERQGLPNVHVVPPPVPECPEFDQKIKPRIEEVIARSPCAPLLFDFTNWDQSRRFLTENTVEFVRFFGSVAATGRPKVYLTIINPGDHRKNIEATMLGFLRFVQVHPNSLLVIKLVAERERTLTDVVWNTLRVQLERLFQRSLLRNDAVVFVHDFLEEKRLLQLMRSADFYLSTSFAEGANMPVLEAMACGTSVISPIHTAMADYLSDDNCIPCRSRQVAVDGETVTGYRIGTVSRYEVTSQDVADALAESAALPLGELDRRRRNALATVTGKYDIGGVARSIESRFEEICHRSTVAAEA